MISDEELLAVGDYAVALGSIDATDKERRLIGYRIIAAFSAQRQRDMEPTKAMLDEGAYDSLDSRLGVKRIFRAMQRAAPLVTDREDGNG